MDQTIFYSWQSDLPGNTNRSAIGKALEKAAIEVGQMIVDEATRGESGSPSIPATVLAKIDRADVFVADISTINAASPGRKVPNPNVVFELGYAAATLGWGRIILLFNTHFGLFPGDLPFDFDRHRTITYNLTPPPPNAQPAAGRLDPLQKTLKSALKTIKTVDPKRPAELRGLTPEQVKHSRDVETARWVLEELHLPTLDNYITELPRVIIDRAHHFYLGLDAVLESSLFYLNDGDLWTSLTELRDAWRRTMSHPGSYHSNVGYSAQVFTNPGDLPLSAKKEIVWNDVLQARKGMKTALDDVLLRIRRDYPEINLQETSSKAYSAYAALLKRLPG